MNLFLKFAFAGCILAVASCTDLDEIFVDPNGVPADQAGAEALYNSVQLGFNDVQNDPYFFAAGLARMDAETGGFTYTATHSATEFDGMWANFYSSFLPDADAFITLAEPLGLDAAAASVKVMKAYGYMQFVDLFGDVPFSEAGQGDADTPNTNPKQDAAADVYAAANALLDEAIQQLDSASNFTIAYDNFYGGNAKSWATLAKTLKLRSAITTRKVGGGSAISDLVAGGDLIDANAENFEWKYGTNRTNQFNDNRHPFYRDSYEEADGTYQSNYYMWLLAESKGFPDPRVRYYFYRQERNIFPDIVGEDPNAFDCIFTAIPDPDVIPPQYEAVSDRVPYCLGSYSQGYFGRDHLNGSGVPPDGDYRTIFGVYPAGGKFDDNTTNGLIEKGGTDGALGAGIEPIWQASFTHFVLAEAVLSGDYPDGNARELLTKGIQLSMNRVTAFESLIDGGEQIASVPIPVFVSDTYAS